MVWNFSFGFVLFSSNWNCFCTDEHTGPRHAYVCWHTSSSSQLRARAPHCRFQQKEAMLYEARDPQSRTQGRGDGWTPCFKQDLLPALASACLRRRQLHKDTASRATSSAGHMRLDTSMGFGKTALKTLSSLHKESRPFFLGDNSIWSFPLCFFP